MVAFGLGVALSPLLADAAAPAGCGAPAPMADGWPVAAPEQQHLDPRLICAIAPSLEKLRNADPNGVVIVRNGALVYEAYFTGQDQRWPEQHWNEPLPILPHDADTKHDLQSITKSVVALLVGIALDRGLIKTADAPVFSFFPEYADLRGTDRDRITLRDLLTMTAGLAWPSKPFLSMGRQTDAATDPYRFALDQPVAASPGQWWHYNNGSAELVGGIVQKVTGRPLDQFAKDALFDPLGITDWEWARMNSGNPAASWGLRLLPRDIAKIGQLVIDHGAWHGKEVVSAAWISDMTAPHIVQHTFSYGYFWWLGTSSINGHKIDVISGVGWGGQRLYVVPNLNLVLVVTAGVYNRDGQDDEGQAGDTVLNSFVLPAALGD